MKYNDIGNSSKAVLTENRPSLYAAKVLSIVSEVLSNPTRVRKNPLNRTPVLNKVLLIKLFAERMIPSNLEPVSNSWTSTVSENIDAISIQNIVHIKFSINCCPTHSHHSALNAPSPTGGNRSIEKYISINLKDNRIGVATVADIPSLIANRFLLAT